LELSEQKKQWDGRHLRWNEQSRQYKSKAQAVESEIFASQYIGGGDDGE
jgi:hypothetical protein